MKLSISPVRALSALLATALLASCSGGDQAGQAGGAVTVGYVVVQPRSVPLQTTLPARVSAYETSEVRPQVTGLIRSRLFTEGALVKAGQPLFQIDPSLYRAAVNQAEANLASARATADAAVSKANRYRPLAEMEAIARQDYVDAEAQARIARAAVAQNSATLETAKINLRFSTVPAPISGRIGRSLTTVGALVSANQADPMAVIQRTDPIFVDMQQSSAQLTALRRALAAGGVSPGSTQVQIKLEDGSTYPFSGQVEFSEVTVSPETGTVTLRARFPNPDSLLLPGMFVTAIFDQAIEANAYLVSQAAVRYDFNGAAYVYVVGPDNKAQRRNIKTQRTSGSDWVVTAGLKTGDKVIVQGLNGLRAGAAIKPVPAGTPQKAGAQPAAPASGKSG